MSLAYNAIKYFSKIDGIIYGTALSSNLIIFSLISLVPEYGVHGVAISAGLMLLISGFMEVPAGILADRFGWGHSVQIGFRFKVIANILIMASILSALMGNRELLWGFIIAEAIADAIGKALISGSYEAGYLSWYAMKVKATGDKDPPPLFVTSFSHSLRYRVGIPIFLVTTSFIVFYFLKSISNYFIIFPLAVLCLIRLFILYRVNKDLGGGGNHKDKGSFDFSSFFLTWPLFTKLVYFKFLRIIIIFIGINKGYELFKLLGFSFHNSWGVGIGVALFIHIFNLLIAKRYFSTISKKYELSHIQTFSFTVLFILSFAFIVFQNNLPIGGQVISLYTFNLLGLVISGYNISAINSSVSDNIESTYRATWLSLAEVFSMVLFSIIISVSLYTTFPFSDLKSLLLVLCLFSLFVLFMQLLRLPSKIEGYSLKNILSSGVSLYFILFGLILGGFYSTKYFTDRSDLLDLSRDLRVNQLVSSIRDPLLQGALVEAEARILDFVGESQIVCIDFYYNDKIILNCKDKVKESLSRIHSKEYHVFMDKDEANKVGLIRAWFDDSDLRASARDIFYEILLASFIISILFILALRKIFTFIFKDFESIVNTILNSKLDRLSKKTFVKEYNVLIDSIHTSRQKASDLEILRITEQQSQQVAHDIRSPLAALDMVMKDIGDIPEQKRLMIRSSVARIHDIANDLLTRNKPHTQANEDLNQSSVVMVSEVLGNLISEKRLQFRDKGHVEFQSDIDEKSYGLFCKVNIKEFQRVISNLLNNACEAITQKSSTITISLSPSLRDSELVEITISDTGKGIPKDIITKLGIKGNSFGKDSGSGLGLYHAKEFVELSGGHLEIHSEVSIGTTITIILPRIEAPQTFVSEIRLIFGDTIVIVDDDQSIHQVWEGRFQASVHNTSQLDLIYFSDPGEFTTWLKSTTKDIKLFLIDFEFLGHKTNGIDLILSNHLEEKAILVTSRYSEEEIRKKCEHNKMKLLPKGLAVYVSINIEEELILGKMLETKSLNILLDDDSIIRMGWQMAAKKNNINLEVFETANELFKVVGTFDKNSTFYIDSNLGDNEKGEVVAKKLFELGFNNLYLATGYDKDQFAHIDYIKGIMGKRAPW